MNDITAKSKAKVFYFSFDNALSILGKFGKGALLAKADIKSAFRLLPKDPAGFNLLGFQSNGEYYFDKCLLVGFTLFCFYFEAFSSFSYWVVYRDITNAGYLHYLDNFLFVSKIDFSYCLAALNKFKDIATFFGISLAVEKTVVPCTSL